MIPTETSVLYQLRLQRYREASFKALDARERWYNAPPGSAYARSCYEDMQAADALERFQRRLLEAVDA